MKWAANIVEIYKGVFMKKTIVILLAGLFVGTSAILTCSCEEAPPPRVTGVLFQGGIQ
jgi:hypothetical protein